MGLEALGIGHYVILGPDRSQQIIPAGTAPITQTPLAPQSVVATDGVGGGLVAWLPPEPVADPVDGYRVEWAPVDAAGVVGAVMGTSATLSASTLDYQITGLVEGSYAARATAHNVSGWGAPSAWDAFYAESGTAVEAAPESPTDLLVTKQTNGTYLATFTPPAAANPPVSEYRYDVDDGSVVTVAATVDRFTITPTPADGDHKLDLVAWNGVAPGSAPATTRFTVATDVAPSPPQNFRQTSATIDGGKFAFDASPSANVVRYEWRAKNSSGSVLKSGSVLAGSTLAFQVTGLLGGSSYTVELWAVSDTGKTSTLVSLEFYVQADNLAVLEYKVSTTSDNRAGFASAQDNAISQGKALRVVGGIGRVDGTAYWKEALTDLRFDTGSGFRRYGDAHGALVRMGSVGPLIGSIAAGGNRGENTLTLSSVAGLAVGDWINANADLKTSHKDTWWAHVRKVTAISGTTITVHLPWHRNREGKAGRVYKLNLARPATATGGIIEHANPATAKGHDLVQMIGCRDTTWTGFEFRNGPGAGLKTCFGVGGHYSGKIHHLRNHPTATQFGYAVNDQGDTETVYEVEAWECRHAFTTQYTQHIGGHGNWSTLLGKGEADRCTVIVDAHDTICTAINSHEPGWGITYGGKVYRTGYWESSFNAMGTPDNTNDPTGVFWRDRGARIHPTLGLDLWDINYYYATKWYSAFTVADIALRMKEQGFVAWPYAEAVELGPGRLRVGIAGQGTVNTTDAIQCAQPMRVSNLETYVPGSTGIDMNSPYGTGTHSNVTGYAKIERASTGVANSALLDNAASIQFVNCTKNLG